MQIQVFAIPMDRDGASLEQFNLFLRRHKVLSVEKVPVVVQGRQFWSFCVEYLERAGGARESARGAANTNSNKPRTDYREVLTDAQLQRFSNLRQLRKQIVDSEAVPVYALFTNAQLADMARVVPRSKNALNAIDGLGDAKVARYGEPLLGMLATFEGPETEVAAGVAEPDAALAAAAVRE